jgi:hypothetical protein
MSCLARAAFLCLLAPVSLGMPALAFQTNDNIASLIRQSTFIFVGRVEKLSATSMKAVPPTDAMAVVRIDQVIDAPGGPPDLAGKSITVQMRQPGSIRAGQQATFFTKGWLLGDSMAVIEMGHVVEANAGAVQEQVNAVHQQMANEKLQSEMATADAIVSGTVRSVYPAKVGHIGSEHDPDWYAAEIAISGALKGQMASKTVTVLFPHSNDVMWHNSPKFKEGEQGIWLLHRNQARLPGIEDQYTALRSLDFQPPEQTERIQQLLKSSR